MALLRAKVRIRGTRPLLFNKFTDNSIPLKKKEKLGVAGNNPDEWKDTFNSTKDGQLYLDSLYIFSCLRAGGKHTPKGRGSLEPDVAATLQILDDKLYLNRTMPSLALITRDERNDVYIDVRPVSRRGVKNIRYRLAISSGWETEFNIMWENTLISREQMEAICMDSGCFAGLGDGRKIGFGRFEVLDFIVYEGKDKLNA